MELMLSKQRVGFYIKNDNETLDFAMNTFEFTKDLQSELDLHLNVIFQINPVIISYESSKISYVELIKSLEKHTNIIHSHKIPTVQGLTSTLDSIIELTQKVTNYLSSTTAFLSNAEVNLKKIFGDKSDKFTTWNDKRKLLHKNNFSYQFLYELRNYSQHSYIPISELNINMNDIQNDQQVTNLSMIISKSALLESGYDWKKFKNIIDNIDDSIDLLPLIHSYNEIIDNIAFNFMHQFFNQLISCHEYLSYFYSTYKIPPNATPVIFIGDTLPGDPVPKKMRPIPITHFEWLSKKYFDLYKNISITKN